MRAFNTAWGLLKAPLLPETIDIDPKKRKGSAMFQFREGEVPLFLYENQLPMTIRPFQRRETEKINDSEIDDEIEVFVDFGLSGQHEDELKRDSPQHWSPGYARFGVSPEGVATNTHMPIVQEGYEERGIGTALYDMMQMLLNEQGRDGSIVPSNQQTTEGYHLWRKAMGKRPRYANQERTKFYLWDDRDEWPRGGAFR